MSDPTTEPIDELLRHAIAKDDGVALDAYLDVLEPADTVRTVLRLSHDDQTRLLEVLPKESAADLLAELPESEAAHLVDQLDAEQAAGILNEVESADQADILGRLPESSANAILNEMAPAEAEDARRLMQYPRETAGGLMISEFLCFRQDLHVDAVLSDLRANVKTYRAYDVQYAYVTTLDQELVGVLPLRDLLLAEPGQSISSLMIRDPATAHVAAPLQDLELFFDRHNYFGVPVIDDARQLVGVVLQHDVREAAEELAGRTMLKMTGILGGEELRTMPLHLRSFRRLSWLSINIVLNVIAASVIMMYQDTLEAVIALAVFLPIISDMSGCSGNQSVAVSMRELSLGLVRPSEFLHVLWKEASIGIINGISLGVLLGTIAFIWKGIPALGLVVGVALATNTLVAVCIGGTVPLLLRGLKLDPALASGPILTTVTDMCGFFLVLSLATIMLPWLI